MLGNQVMFAPATINSSNHVQTNSRTVRAVPCQAQHSSDRAASDVYVYISTGLIRPKRPQQRSPQHNNTSSKSQERQRSQPTPGSSITGRQPADKDLHSSAGSGAAAVRRRPGQQQGQASVSPRQLTAWLKAATCPAQLLQRVQQHAEDLNHIHLSAAYTQAVEVCRHGAASAQKESAATAQQQLLSELHQASVQLQQQCGARELANVIWSCGRLSSPARAKLLLPLFSKTSTLQLAKPQEVSNSLWALATLQLQLTGAELQQLLWRFSAVLSDAAPQAVSNTLWAVATMGQQVSPVQLQQLMGRFAAVLPRVKPQDVSNTLWAVATMGQQVPQQQLQLLLSAFVKLLPAATPQAVSTVLLACGRMKYQPTQLLQRTQHLQQCVAAAQPQELANMAWACGELGYRGQLLPGALLQQAVKLLPDVGTGSFTPQGLCNLCWSAAVLDLQQCVPQVLELAAAASQVFNGANDEDCLQLHQVHMWLLDSQLPAPGHGLSGVLTQQQLEQCRATWEEQLTATAKQQASRLQQLVYAAVLRLPSDMWQQQPQPEQPTADKACLIDITAVTAMGVKVAIEVEGPHHYIQPSSTLSGSTLYRNRALAARGYVVISVPYWDWKALDSTAQQQRYLLAKLSGLGGRGVR